MCCDVVAVRPDTDGGARERAEVSASGVAWEGAGVARRGSERYNRDDEA